MLNVVEFTYLHIYHIQTFVHQKKHLLWVTSGIGFMSYLLRYGHIQGNYYMIAHQIVVQHKLGIPIGGGHWGVPNTVIP